MCRHDPLSALPTRMVAIWFMLVAAVISGTSHALEATGNRCISCHPAKATGFSETHRFAATGCPLCHGGDDTSPDEAEAHRQLVAFPGNMDNAERTCGKCHAEQVQTVTRNFMHTGKGMVNVTRYVFGETRAPEDHGHLARLGSTPADTLLRKQCAGCHLGHNKHQHGLDVVEDRGGGCLACHINAYPERSHPALTARVEDGRCFGCHSRSGRISLSYAGLAETEASTQPGTDPRARQRLPDGRTLEDRPSDAHHKAGMSCIDCHTSTGLMGAADHLQHQQQAVDISCTDCHRNENARTTLASWPERYRRLKRFVPATTALQQPFLTTGRSGTPLWNIEVRADGYYLHPKQGGNPLKIPEYQANSHTPAEEHRRLTCSACHSQWAPQCYGCHLEYDPKATQWDHSLSRVTAGRWRQKRWDVRNELAPLGVTANDQIAPFVPGMILTIEHPDWNRARFVRLFARISPHTTGRSRSCRSCHQSPIALGLGAGTLERSADGWQVSGQAESLTDGLPADAWTTLQSLQPGMATQTGDRSFTPGELLRILNVEPPSRPGSERQ